MGANEEFHSKFAAGSSNGTCCFKRSWKWEVQLCKTNVSWVKEPNEKVVSVLRSVFYWSCLILEKLAMTFCAGLEWRNGNKILIYHAKGSCRSSLLALSTPFLPSTFWQQVSRGGGGTSENIVSLPALPEPPHPHSYLLPLQTLPLILSPALFFFPLCRQR